jgi:hypothetical protein
MGKYSEQLAAGSWQRSEGRNSTVGAAFQPRYHCVNDFYAFYDFNDLNVLNDLNDFYDLLLPPDYWLLTNVLSPCNGGESHYVRSQRRQSGSQ